MAPYNLDVDLECDIVSSITDGTSVIKKFGKETSPIHVSCLAHAMHLCVCNLCYKSEKNSDALVNETNDYDDDEDDEELNDVVDTDRLIPEFSKIVAKPRKIIKIF